MRWLPSLRFASALLFVACVALSIVVLRTSTATRRWAAATGSALVDYSLADRALQLDLLNARAGLLRNYDPLNAHLRSERESLSDLARLPMRSDARALLGTLMDKSQRREALVERFKSDNALLQNSLARFTANGNAADDDRDVLSARILKLTLDTSPQTVSDTRAALARLPHAPPGTSAAQLISHARLLVAVLPEIDALLHAIRVMRMENGIEALSLMLRDQAAGDVAHLRRLRLLLAATGLLLALCALSTVFAQRLRTREFKAQAANERLNAAIAIPLIDTGKGDFAARVQQAVHRLALHIGARRLQLVVPGTAGPVPFSWPDASVHPQCLQGFVAAAEADGAWAGDRVIVSRGRDGIGPMLDREMGAAGMNDLVLLRTTHPLPVTIGFEPAGSALAQRGDHIAGLASAIVAIAHGARREMMQVERERLERTLSRARRMETIGAMASGIAHNFNNIIGAIRGFAEIGQERTRSGSQARYTFDEIQIAVERARELVDEILNFAKQGRSVKQPIDIRVVLDQAVRLLEASARDPGGFRFDPPKTACVVLGSGSAFQQVFLNICTNAAHASGGRPVDIEATRHVLDAEHQLSHGSLDAGRYVVVSVTDRGPGIPAAASARLFEPFFTTKRGGTGLGLSTAWEIVQDHGGTIDVATAPEGGARFSVWLPEMLDPPASQPIGDGSRILLIGAEDRLAAEEELLAELGYEPIGMALPADRALVREFSADCDAVLIADADTAAVERQAREIAHIAKGRPLLLATVGSVALDIPGSVIPLSFPLSGEELTRLLFTAHQRRQSIEMA